MRPIYLPLAAETVTDTRKETDKPREQQARDDGRERERKPGRTCPGGKEMMKRRIFNSAPLLHHLSRQTQTGRRTGGGSRDRASHSPKHGCRRHFVSWLVSGTVRCLHACAPPTRSSTRTRVGAARPLHAPSKPPCYRGPVTTRDVWL